MGLSTLQFGRNFILKQPVTIVDVARRAGVSLGTVSNVINGRVSVRAEKRRLVEAAIAELGFTRSMLATGMRRQQSHVIGLCVPFTNFQNFSAIADAIEKISAESGYELMQVYSRQDPETELSRIERLLAFRIGGLILIPSLEPKAALERIARAKVPTVLLNRPFDDPRFDQIMVDHRAVIDSVVDGLVERGHRRIVLASQYPKLSVTRLRTGALREAAKRGKATAISLTTGGSEAIFAERLAPFLKRGEPPTALICSNSIVTTWVIRAARAAGIKCPDDFSLMSLDDPEWADVVTPPLSVVHQPTELLARHAWDTLVGRMEAKRTKPVRELLPASIVFRQSVGQWTQ